MGGGVCLLARLGALHGMQDLVALIDAGSYLLLACETDGVVEMTNNASVSQVQLRGELKCQGHGRITGAEARWFLWLSWRDNKDTSRPRNFWTNP
jgi:hypothetical protein